jgi:hypothetical protein
LHRSKSAAEVHEENMVIHELNGHSRSWQVGTIGRTPDHGIQITRGLLLQS